MRALKRFVLIILSVVLAVTFAMPVLAANSGFSHVFVQKDILEAARKLEAEELQRQAARAQDDPGTYMVIYKTCTPIETPKEEDKKPENPNKPNDPAQNPSIQDNTPNTPAQNPSNPSVTPNTPAQNPSKPTDPKTPSNPDPSKEDPKTPVTPDPSQGEDKPANPDVSNPNEEPELPRTELAYWFEGIDTAKYQERLHKAAYKIPTTGKGYCASWVSYVYQEAGLGFLSGNACDMWAEFCISEDTEEIQEGMLIAVPTYPTSELGKIYGHVGVLVLNEDYVDPDEEVQKIEEQINMLQEELAQLTSDLEDSANAASTSVPTDLPADATSGTATEEIASPIETAILQKQSELDAAEARRTALQNKLPLTYKMDDFTIFVDRYGHEKWLVVDNIGRITETRLSQWIVTYNAEKKVAWGWGHYFIKPVKWAGDVASFVPFVFHEEEATEEDLEEETSEEETTEDPEKDPKKTDAKEENTDKPEEETPKTPEKETTGVPDKQDPGNPEKQTSDDPEKQNPETAPEGTQDPATGMEPESPQPAQPETGVPVEEPWTEPETQPAAEPYVEPVVVEPAPVEEPLYEPAPEPVYEPATEAYIEPVLVDPVPVDEAVNDASPEA